MRDEIQHIVMQLARLEHAALDLQAQRTAWLTELQVRLGRLDKQLALASSQS